MAFDNLFLHKDSYKGAKTKSQSVISGNKPGGRNSDIKHIIFFHMEEDAFCHTDEKKQNCT